MTELLDTEQQKTLARVRGVVADLRTGLAGVPADADDDGTIKAALEQLDDFFLLVVVGEFNAGKSALINDRRFGARPGRHADYLLHPDSSALSPGG